MATIDPQSLLQPDDMTEKAIPMTPVPGVPALSKHDALDAQWKAWKAKPDQAGLRMMVDTLSPTIKNALFAIGAPDDPVLKAKAKVFAVKALEGYDPTLGASIPTHVTTQLMPLRRFKRQVTAVTAIPERTQLDAYYLQKCEKELRDKKGDEPTVEELSDYSKMPIKRIAKVRRTMRVVPTEAAFGEDGISSTDTDFSLEAHDFVYPDLDYVNKKIMEHRWGYGGGEIVQVGKVLAQKLGISEVDLTRRTRRIAMKLEQTEEALKKTQTDL